MNIIDIAAIAIVALGVIQGCRRRLSGELAHLISVVAAFGTGLFFFRPVGDWFMAHTRLTDQGAHVVAFIATMLASLVVMTLIRIVLGRVMKVVIEPEVDRTGGAIAGFVRASVFVLIVFIIMNMWPHDFLNRIFGEESLIGSVVVKCMPALRDAVEEQKAKVDELRERDSSSRPRPRKRSTD